MTEPTGETYGRLLDFIRHRASTFTLVLSGSGKKSARALQLLASLDQYLEDKVETREWPGTVLSEGFTGVLYRFRVDDGSVEFLRHAAPSLYAWCAPARPDDLCFYRADGSTLLTSTTHEREGDLRLSQTEFDELKQSASALRLERVLEH